MLRAFPVLGITLLSKLSSESYPNKVLLERALARIKPGDILMAHLGIWSRQEPWAPAVLEPLMQGLKSRGMGFAPLREHPQYAAWLKTARSSSP